MIWFGYKIEKRFSCATYMPTPAIHLRFFSHQNLTLFCCCLLLHKSYLLLALWFTPGPGTAITQHESFSICVLSHWTFEAPLLLLMQRLVKWGCLPSIWTTSTGEISDCSNRRLEFCSASSTASNACITSLCSCFLGQMWLGPEMLRWSD